jgi:multicomponent Na+:H+ antiporter subunit B
MRPRVMREHVVLRVVAKLLIPMILLFGVYIQLHGEYSAGGGFQAGIIFAAGIVLYTLIYGLETAQQVISTRAAHVLTAGGALLYLAVGVWSMLAGGNFLEYKVLHADAHTAETIGIIVIELGVGITVAGVAMRLFYSFAGRRWNT